MSNFSEAPDQLSPVKRALVAVKDLQARLDALQRAKAEPIAIIGMACRFPGAPDPAAFWRLLRDGGDAITPVPAGRWDVDAYYDPDPEAPGKMSTRWGGFVERVDEFDAEFFGITPREAICTDPQQRLFLEIAWEALEAGGQAIDRLAGSLTGVFAGICSSDYLWHYPPDAVHIDAYTSTGISYSLVPNRLSYLLDFRGPSVAVDTACSSSLVAVHLACQSLRIKECNLAVAGGVNLILSPLGTVSLSKFGMMSPDGRCKTFDARADGFVRGEGCGVVALKRLSDARAAGDPVLALIRGSATNQDGRTSGLTAPNGLSQQAVIRHALENAGVSPSQLSFIETHGTGTALGDPIEIEALSAVVSPERSPDQTCALGSVKTNIGHLEAAAGVAGLIKVVLSLQHDQIPPHLHFKKLNPNISLDPSFVIPTQLLSWPRGAGPRIAGVSSFGFGGTNAHVVVEEAAAGDARSQTAPAVAAAHLLPLSARSREALVALARRYMDWFAGPGAAAALHDVCYTAAQRRSHHEHRLAVVHSSHAEAREQLESFAAGAAGERAGPASGRKAPGRHSALAFVFAGQGTQWAGMGKELFAAEPVFRRRIEECDLLLRQAAGWSLLDELNAEESRSRLKNTEVAQPALFALQVALADLWRSWGIAPDAVVGHSMGEFAAAHAAGILSLADALRAVSLRGRVMQKSAGRGQMLAVALPPAEVQRMLAGYETRLAIAAVNSPLSTVLSGEAAALDAVAQTLAEHGIGYRRLKGEYAFHSPQMDSLRVEFLQSIAGLQPKPAAVPMVSTVTGRFVEGRDLDASYWGRNFRQPVRFQDAMSELIEKGFTVFLEIGAHPVLNQSIGQILSRLGRTGMALPSLRRGRPERAGLLASLGSLYAHGFDPDWSNLYPSAGRCVPLPAYPWQRQRYWLDNPERESRNKSAGSSRIKSAAAPVHPLLGRRLRSALPIFESEFSAGLIPFLSDHQIDETVVVPGAAYIEMALAAAAETPRVPRALFDRAATSSPFVLEDIVIREPLLLPIGASRTVQSVLTPEDSAGAAWQIFSLAEPPKEGEEPDVTLHVSGILQRGGISEPPTVSLAGIQTRCPEEAAADTYYDRLQQWGLHYGPSFRGIQKLWRGDGEALGELRLPEQLAAEAKAFHLHPALLDAGFQVLGACLTNHPDRLDARDPYVLAGLERFEFHGGAVRHLWCHAVLRPADETNPQTLIGDLHLCDASGRVVAQVTGLCARRYSRENQAGIAGARALSSRTDEGFAGWLYQVQWQPRSRFDQELERRPDYLPSPEQIARRLKPHVARLKAEHDLDRYEEMAPLLEDLSRAYVRRALQRLGWQPAAFQRFSAADLAGQLGIVSQHHRLLGRLLQMLASAGTLAQAGAEFLVQQWPAADGAADGVDSRWQALMDSYPACEVELGLFQRCGRQLAEVLRGECDPLQLLFSEGSLATAERLYGDSPLAQVYNKLVQETMTCALESLPNGRTVHVLELGAGTGGTTAPVLSSMPAKQSEYVFTDVSPLFTAKAKEKFRDFAFVRYETLDIEQDAARQGFAGHQFDVILAAHVLHATRDLRETLRHVKQLLSSEGLLVLLESTSAQGWLDLVFGLTEGWWKFTDVELRGNYPLLPPGKWRQLLESEGFSEVAAVPEAELPQQVLLMARGPRVERRGTAGAAGDRAWRVSTPGVLPREQSARWLILADRQGFGRNLAAQFESRGERCAIVTAGAHYEASGENGFTIDPARPQDFQQLLREPAGERSGWSGVVHLWGIDGPAAAAMTADDLRAAQSLACGSALYLTQALVQHRASGSPRLWLVTRNSQPAEPLSTAGLSVAQAPLWGLGRVIALEHPELWGGLVDLDPDTGAEEAAWILAQELQRPERDDHIAFRRGQRYRARLARAPAAETTSPDTLRLRPDATYLIAGGLGGLGLKVAAWMVERGARHLVLAGRSGASPAALEALSELEKTGTRIIAARADVAEPEQVERIISEIDGGMPPLRGVVHLAGVLADDFLVQQDWQRFAGVLAPKVDGAWNLHLLTQSRPLDFFVLFSSAAALAGSPGQGNHAAANAFLDALAHYRRGLGLPATSINWGAWAEVGAAAERKADARAARRGMGSIAPRQGLQVLAHIMRAGYTQIGVMPIDWRQVGSQIESSLLADLVREEAGAGSANSSSLSAQTLLAADAAERPRMLEVYLREEIARVMRLPDASKLDPQQPINTLGIDSLMAIEVRTRVQKDLGVVVPVANVLQGPSIAQLAALLLQQLSVGRLLDVTHVKPAEAADDENWEVLKL